MGFGLPTPGFGPVRRRLVALLIALAMSPSISGQQKDLRLLEAVKRRDQNAFSSLIRAKADINASQPDGATALAWAVHLGQHSMAEALLTVRVPFEERDLAAGREEFACHRSQYTSAEMALVNAYLAHAWNGNVWLRPWSGTLHDPKLFSP